MRSPHILLVILILVALASQAYVQLEYDYRDAPENVRLALLAGVGAMMLLAILIGPRLLRRGRAIIPV